jgi:hypothetical protein
MAACHFPLQTPAGENGAGPVAAAATTGDGSAGGGLPGDGSATESTPPDGLSTG